MVRYTSSAKDASTHQIGIPNSKYMRYAHDMIILETMSEVKVKVTVTQNWYATLPHLKNAPTHQIWNSYLN